MNEWKNGNPETSFSRCTIFFGRFFCRSKLSGLVCGQVCNYVPVFGLGLQTNTRAENAARKSPCHCNSFTGCTS